MNISLFFKLFRRVAFAFPFFLIFFHLLLGCSPQYEDKPTGLPSGFVYLASVDPTILQSVRFATSQNFIGEPLDGYKGERIIVTRPTAEALKRTQDSLRPLGYSLVVYDGYRPQRAINHALKWIQDSSDQGNRCSYFPHIEDKRDLLQTGYVAERSDHTRGSAVDVTLIRLGQTPQPVKVTKRRLLTSKDPAIPYLDDGTVDMGTHWGYVGKPSRQGSSLLDQTVGNNRNILRAKMEEQGFKSDPEAWWRFTLADEPYPHSYFDFPVK